MSETAEQLESMEGDIFQSSVIKASVSSMSRGAVASKSDLDGPLPLLDSEATLHVEERLEESFNSSESNLASESCSEFDPPSPDSIFDESNILDSQKRVIWITPGLNQCTQTNSATDSRPLSEFMRIPIRNILPVNKGVSWDLTLGDIVQEIFLHLQPGLASTVKEVLITEHTSSRCVCMSSIDSSRATVSSTANFLSGDPHTSFFQLGYGVDEEMKEMEKILDNPWNPDETIDLFRLQIETMDFWKKDFGRLNKVLEDKEAQSVQDPWDTTIINVVSNRNSGRCIFNYSYLKSESNIAGAT